LAMDSVVNWNPPKDTGMVILHLNGTNDLLFPISKIKNAIPVSEGTHVMNMTSSVEVNRLLLKAIM